MRQWDRQYESSFAADLRRWPRQVSDSDSPEKAADDFCFCDGRRFPAETRPNPEEGRS
jgi:hypothetical protein